MECEVAGSNPRNPNPNPKPKTNWTSPKPNPGTVCQVECVFSEEYTERKEDMATPHF